MILSNLQHFLFSLGAQNQTYIALPATHVYCIYYLFFYGAVFPVGLTKLICLLLSISNMHLRYTISHSQLNTVKRCYSGQFEVFFIFSKYHRLF